MSGMRCPSSPITKNSESGSERHKQDAGLDLTLGRSGNPVIGKTVKGSELVVWAVEAPRRVYGVALSQRKILQVRNPFRIYLDTRDRWDPDSYTPLRAHETRHDRV